MWEISLKEKHVLGNLVVTFLGIQFNYTPDKTRIISLSLHLEKENVWPVTSKQRLTF